MSQILPTQKGSVAYFTQPQPISQKIACALGAISLLGGIFLILALHQQLPWRFSWLHPNVFNFVLAYGLASTGIGAIALGIYLFTQKRQEEIIISETEGDSWDDDLKRAAQYDKLAEPNDWRRGPGAQEHEQSLSSFLKCEALQVNGGRTHLKIYVIDQGVTQVEKETLRIVGHYLESVHGVRVSIETKETLSVDFKRGVQYAFEPNIVPLTNSNQEDEFALGFTSKDLYPSSQPTMNFILGGGIWQCASGLFSLFRFRGNSGDKEQLLVRLMRLASHEFGHMRGLDHCTRFACCMQGVNSVSEGDKIPLTFCSLDMAKICHINGWTLQEGYRRQLTFFESFEERYKKKVDFSREISQLKIKLASLDK